jgi:hypothetical protein
LGSDRSAHTDLERKPVVLQYALKEPVMRTPKSRTAEPIEPAVVDTACHRLEQAMGCTYERAFDLLYGAAASQGGGLYQLARIVSRASDVKPFVRERGKFHH